MVPDYPEESDGARRLLVVKAYRISPVEMSLAPAGVRRDWMEGTSGRYAYRCLPMLIANESGWFLKSAHRVRASWNGSFDPSGVKIEVLDGPLPCPAISCFGCGIVTWNIPYLFRTPPGYNLLVRGPSNWPKDGISPLEGVVEADWSEASFTMNWKLTRRRHRVTFEIGDPVCMIVPQRRGELESFTPEYRAIESAAELNRNYLAWSASRRAFNDELRRDGSDQQREGWMKHYFRGQTIQNQSSAEHQTKLFVKPFEHRAEPKE